MISDEAIDSLAILCASIIEYYRKAAELLFVGCQSLTPFSADIELLAVYRKQHEDFSKMLVGIHNLFAKYMKQSSTNPDGNERCDLKCKQKLLNQIFIQSSSSQIYATNAYLRLESIFRQSILFCTSTNE